MFWGDSVKSRHDELCCTKNVTGSQSHMSSAHSYVEPNSQSGPLVAFWKSRVLPTGASRFVLSGAFVLGGWT